MLLSYHVHSSIFWILDPTAVYRVRTRNAKPSSRYLGDKNPIAEVPRYVSLWSGQLDLIHPSIQPCQIIVAERVGGHSSAGWLFSYASVNKVQQQMKITLRCLDSFDS